MDDNGPTPQSDPEAETESGIRFWPWDAFDGDQKTRHERLLANFPTQERRFSSLEQIRREGQIVAETPVTDDESLKTVLRLIFMEPVMELLRHFQEIDAVQAIYGIGSGLRFDPVIRQPLYDMSCSPHYACTYEPPGRQERVTAYLVVLKNPNKLTLPVLHAGLRSMILRNVEDDALVKKRTQLRSEAKVVSAVAHTFHCMMQEGLTYGCIVTGLAYLFLKVDWDTNPVSLLFHLSEPRADVRAHPSELRFTDVGQVFAFTALACDSMSKEGPRSENERQKALCALRQWVVRFGSQP